MMLFFSYYNLITFVFSYSTTSFEPLTPQIIIQSYSPNDCTSKCILSQYIDKSNINQQYYWLTTSSLNNLSNEWVIKNNIYSNTIIQYNNSQNQISNQLPYITPTAIPSQNNSFIEQFSSCTSILTNNSIICYTDSSEYNIKCKIFDNQYLNGQWSSPISVAQNTNNYSLPFKVICLNDSIGNYLVILHDQTTFFYTLLDPKGNIKQMKRLLFAPNITFQGKLDMNYIAVECNFRTNVILIAWMNIPDEHSIVLQKNVYGIFIRYDERNKKLVLVNNKSKEINLNSDFWSAYDPVYIELNEQNNCCFFMPYKEFAELNNVGVGFLSVFDDQFHHMYHHSDRANDDIDVGLPSLNVDYKVIDLTQLRNNTDVLNYFAILYLVENDNFNGTMFNISVYSLNYISNLQNTLEVIMDVNALMTVDGDVKHFCVDLDVSNGVLFISWVQYIYDDINICKQDSAIIVAQSWNVTLS